MNVEQVKAWLHGYEQRLSEVQELLDELDNRIGDGDHGTNMLRGFQVACAQMTEAATPSEAVHKLAMGLLSTVGGASGPLYATAFLRMSQTWREMEEVSLKDLSDGLNAALAGIQQRGSANVGDKTMVDVWAPSVECILSDPTERGLLEASRVARQAALNTRQLVARRGRASYLGDRSVGTCDPGSVSSAILFECLAITLVEGMEAGPWTAQVL
ncbi:MAG: dihydroxyacetone kinase subunit L [Alicyclobacillus mali]|uniref:dihydroxyacetone kinase subunit DhaL n=1 Tax=Alicyclobacillus mali (ex Roth et al. 2021) TaxID=1123961 RepID=UPI001A9008FC|nr:dihydroxyacetone kinase subunit DhaL [Alicyclobacillus mali (ex Roth et al. 2021)]MCL6490032.1 dihydroxyacetone kinase subunit L [Alicyclobacillus mali (ex Roth et al. 2021)]